VIEAGIEKVIQISCFAGLDSTAVDPSTSIRVGIDE